MVEVACSAPAIERGIGGKDGLRLETHKIGAQLAEASGIPSTEAPFNDEVSAVLPAVFVQAFDQSLPERRDRRFRWRHLQKNADARHMARLLR